MTANDITMKSPTTKKGGRTSRSTRSPTKTNRTNRTTTTKKHGKKNTNKVCKNLIHR